MNEQSDLARASIRRYRDAISPSFARRESLVDAVVARVEAGSVGAGVSASAATRAPWLVLVGTAVLAVALAPWWARARDGAVMERGLAAFVDAAPARVAESTPPAPSHVEHATTLVEPPVETARSSAALHAKPTRARARPPAPVPDAVRPSPPPSLVDEEVRLLREANLALRSGDPVRARARFDEHAQRFTDGALVELRELGYALLHCGSAAPEDSADVVASFARRFPDSPHLPRLRRECPGPR